VEGRNVKNKDYGVVILAAGKGTRMRSDLPKVLHTLLEKPLLGYLLDATSSVAHRWIVVGHGHHLVEAAFPGHASSMVLQAEQLGTGHAVREAWPRVVASGVEYVCVLSGDTPLVQARHLDALVESCRSCGAAVGFVSVELDDPTGYGRVVRDFSGAVQTVVEEKDLGRLGVDAGIREVNAGVYALRVQDVGPLLEQLDTANAQAEYYLPQVIFLAREAGLRVAAVPAEAAEDFWGVNSPAQLVALEEVVRRRVVDMWRNRAVIVRMPQSVRIGPDVELAPGVEIIGPVEIYGKSQIMAGSRVESHVWMRDCRLEGATVRSFSHLEGAVLGPGCVAGPFARLRPGTVLESGARVGNFVETKKAHLGPGVKAGHLSYLGDAVIGADTNIGAGTITCNYDGVRKHSTRIEPRAFIGSNTALVAPVTIGEGAVVGAGSVVTKDVPRDMLCVARARQVHLPWRRKEKDHAGET
jgi:bifunctional UDP-N-acetylglucosamine pyrophosphorylase/glucosamine-1-phosphate N-acetyltransferase